MWKWHAGPYIRPPTWNVDKVSFVRNIYLNMFFFVAFQRTNAAQTWQTYSLMCSPALVFVTIAPRKRNCDQSLVAKKNKHAQQRIRTACASQSMIFAIWRRSPLGSLAIHCGPDEDFFSTSAAWSELHYAKLDSTRQCFCPVATHFIWNLFNQLYAWYLR